MKMIISFRDFLAEEAITEVFDSPYDIKDGENDMVGFMMKMSAEMKGAKNVKVYDVGNSGDKMATFEHDGALEIHHLHSSGIQGEMLKDSTKPNPRFVSTAIQIGKDHVESSGKVRIVGTPEVHQVFEPLAHKVGSRLGYNVTARKIDDTSFYSPFPVELHSIEITKKESK